MEELKKHITDDEKILWAKKPTYGLFNKYDLFSVPLSLFFFGGISLKFTLFLYVSFLNNPASAFYFLTAGLLVYIISFYFILGRFLYRKKRRSRELYAITNKRALILTCLAGEELRQVNLKEAKVFVKSKNIYFDCEKNTAAELFYNFGLDVFFKIRPKRTFVFLKTENPEELVKKISEVGENGEM